MIPLIRPQPPQPQCNQVGQLSPPAGTGSLRCLLIPTVGGGEDWQGKWAGATGRR